jgi:hypothetical protein
MAMPTRRIVRQGESLAQIAAEHGLAPETIWSAPDNRELAQARRNYNVLAPGDVLIIPDKRIASVPAAVDRRHTFRRKGVPAKLRVQLYDGETPRADLDYELIYGVTTLTGTTTADGVLEHWVPTSLRRATLRLPGSPDVTIEIGHLDPIDSIAGAQARLRNLGYGCRLSGRYDSATAEAIRRFQARHELERTGALDDATRAELERLHDTTDHP